MFKDNEVPIFCIVGLFQKSIEYMYHIFSLERFALSPSLLTPVLHPTNQAEERYNSAHKRTRQVIERAFGVSKMRFRCLHRSGGDLMYEPVKCCRIIVACFMLHNICTEHNLPIDDEGQERDENDDGDNENDNNVVVRRANEGGIQVRRQLIHARFQ